MLPLELLYPGMAVGFLAICLYMLAGSALWNYRRTGRLTWPERVVLVLAGASLVCLAEGTFVEPDWPEVTHTSIKTPHLPPGTRLRIVQLSDVHSEATPRLETRLPELVAAEHPDLIAFTGDAANTVEGAPTFRALMTALAKIAPTYGVKGNWDINPRLPELFAGTGAVELKGKPVALRVHGAPLTLNGAAYTFGRELQRAVQAMPHQGLRVLLYHTPDEIDEAPGQVDLYLAGHTHGGQVRLPFYGAVVTMSTFGKQYEMGRYEVGGTTLYVNRGVGMEGHFPLKVRFLCRPEVAVIDLVGR